MLITLDYKNRRPLCDQLVEAVIRQGACGAIAPGEQLPSVRAMAQDLGVNPNTVQKAYRQLEAAGVIVTVPGKGSFLSRTGDAQKQMQAKGREKLLAGLHAALEAGMAAQEVYQCCCDYLQQKEGFLP